MTFGEKIQELRKKNNLSQENLAEKLNITRQTISKWELNETSPDIKQASELAKIFSVSLDDLANIKLDVECSKNRILGRLIGRDCYLDIDSDDLLLTSRTICKIIDINKQFIKLEFKYNNKTVTKLIDISLVSSIKRIKEEEDK